MMRFMKLTQVAMWQASMSAYMHLANLFCASLRKYVANRAWQPTPLHYTTLCTPNYLYSFATTSCTDILYTSLYLDCVGTSYLSTGYDMDNVHDIIVLENKKHWQKIKTEDVRLQRIVLEIFFLQNLTALFNFCCKVKCSDKS